MLDYQNTTQQQGGFTLIDLVVSAVILIIIFSFVLANFRGAAQNDLNLALQKIISDIKEAQTMGLAGKIFMGDYPEGGYGLKLARCTTPPCSYQIFADLNSNVYPDLGIREVPTEFSRILLGKNFIEAICYSTENQPQFPPFDSSNGSCLPANGWQDPNFFAVTFKHNQVLIRTVLPPQELLTDIKYISGLLKNQAIGNQAYFYIAKETGLISSGLLK